MDSMVPRMARAMPLLFCRPRRGRSWATARSTRSSPGRPNRCLLFEVPSIDKDVGRKLVTSKKIAFHDHKICDLSGFDRARVLVDTE